MTFLFDLDKRVILHDSGRLNKINRRNGNAGSFSEVVAAPADGMPRWSGAGCI